ncbi:hypothetical protein [Novosphingobium gossypii]|uniref:hypothetical protein n=1 Tax=Novosphingobium gossypii TaxID=1604774 RepID=UPI003D24520D
MNKDAIANSLIAKLSAHLDEIEVIDAMVAAAHVEAAIDALRRQFAIANEVSNTDEATQDG